MIPIEFKKYDFKLNRQNEKTYILDEVRKKYVILSPEEWVRQNFIHYFIYDLKFPKGKIAIEKEIKINGLKKRFDLLIFDSKSEPYLLLECKAQNEHLNAQVLEQGLQYNLKLKVPYYLISNGTFSYGWQLKAEGLIELNQIPAYV